MKSRSWVPAGDDLLKDPKRAGRGVETGARGRRPGPDAALTFEVASAPAAGGAGRPGGGRGLRSGRRGGRGRSVAAVARARACRLGPSRPILAALAGGTGPAPPGLSPATPRGPRRARGAASRSGDGAGSAPPAGLTAGAERRPRDLGQVTRRLLRGWASASASPDCPRTQSPQRGRAQAGAVGPIPRPGGRGGGVQEGGQVPWQLTL